MDYFRHHFFLVFVLSPFFYILASSDPLPSWNEGKAKQAILEFVSEICDENSPHYIPIDERIATFDQDGTLWVEHPMYIEMVYNVNHLLRIHKKKSPLSFEKPIFSKVKKNSRNLSALSYADLEQVMKASMRGMTVEEYQCDVEKWLRTAKHPRWQRLYTDLVYLPMIELIRFFQEHDFSTYIVSGSGQDFIRVYSEKAFQIPIERVCGGETEVKYTYDKEGNPILIKTSKVVLDDNFSGKIEGVHFMIGKRPLAAFGNSTGDRQMLGYTKSGKGPRLAMLILHDDAIREYAYGPAQNLPNTFIGTFSQALYNEAIEKGWIVVSMKDDWNKIFSFDTKR